MATYRFAVAARIKPREMRCQVLSRHRTSAAAERAAKKRAAWDVANGYEPSEAVCLDDDGDIVATVEECRSAGTLEE